MKERTLVLALVVGSAALIPVACGPKQGTDNTAQFGFGQQPDAGAYANPGYGTSTYPTGQPGPDAAAPVPTPAPTPTSTVVAPTAFDPAVQQIVRAQMAPLAQKHARGMRAEGDIIGGSLQEGQIVEQTIMLNPGKCYTVIAQGLPMVQEVSITLSATAPIPGSPALPIAGSTGTPGTLAVLGDSPNCFKYLVPIPAMGKVTVKVVRGSGAVGAQVYVK